jgi:Golgi phosphoprotein 3 GPP34
MRRMTLREDLFLLAHDDSGKLLIPENNLGAGLAGATLIGLLLDKRVAVGEKSLEVMDPAPTGDAESDATISAIAANTAPVGPRAWVSWISHGAYERVGDSMVQSGLVRRATTRRLGLVPVARTVVEDSDDLVRVRSKVRFAIHSRGLPDPETAALCGLVRILRLERSLLLSMAPADLLIGLERMTEANDVTVRQVTHAVDAVITAALFR